LEGKNDHREKEKMKSLGKKRKRGSKKRESASKT